MIAANFSRYFFPLPFILITFLLVGRAYGDENTARTMVEDWVGTPGGTDIATVFDRSRSNWFLNYQEYFFLAESLTESGIFEEYHQKAFNATEAKREEQSTINCGNKKAQGMKGPCLHYMAGTTNTQKFRFTDEFSTDFGSSSSDGIFISVSLGVVEKVIIVDVNPGDGKDCDWWVTSRSWYFDGGTRTAKAINAYTGMNGFLYKSCYIEGQNGREYVWGHMVFP